MYCRKCGKYLPDDSDFCTACGTRVLTLPEADGSVPPSVQTPQAEEGEAATPTPPSCETEKSSAKGGVSLPTGLRLGRLTGKRKLLIPGAIALLLLLTVIGVACGRSAAKACLYYGGCANERANGSSYCYWHLCDYPGCTSAKSYSGDYCYSHNCAETLCDSVIYEDSEYCYSHQKYSQSNPIPYSKARTIAEEAVSENVVLQLQFKSFGGYAHSIKYLDVASLTSVDANPGAQYTFLAKGTYFSYDDYGDLIDIYKYEVEIDVAADGTAEANYPKVSKK